LQDERYAGAAHDSVQTKPGRTTTAAAKLVVANPRQFT
jgi:hypothetical protein